MNELFLRVLNLNISTSWLLLAILLLRPILKKAPKGSLVLLWGIAAVRLLLPFSIKSPFSLIPSAEPIPLDIELDSHPAIDSGIPAVNQVINPMIADSLTPTPSASINPLQVWISLGAVLWTIGVSALLLYAAFSYWQLHRKTYTAVLLRDTIFQSEYVPSPFVLGILKPRIYLPYNMKDPEMAYVIAHEQAHIRRGDHWWKPLGFLLLTFHWFNPLMWLAYTLLCRDMELACDESVIRKLGSEQRADYTQALVACSVTPRMAAVCPLAFGEVGVKTRVESVLNYRKPAFWTIAAAAALCVITAVCYLTNPMETAPDLSFLNYENAISIVADIDEVRAIYCPSSENNSPNHSIQIGGATGADLAKQLDQWEWKKCAAPRYPLPSPGSVAFVIEEDYRITVHHRKQGHLFQYAVVAYQDEVQYYRIDRSDYPDAVALVHAPALHSDAFDVKDSFQTQEASQTQYHLTIGESGVYRIEVSTPVSSGGCMNANGRPFKKGETIWLEPLDGFTDLQGVTITATDEDGYDLYSIRISDYYNPEDPDAPIVCGHWVISAE